MKTQDEILHWQRELLYNWRERAIRASLAHYRQSEIYRTIDACLLVFNVVSAIFVMYLTNNELFKIQVSDSDSPYENPVLDILGIIITQNQLLSLAGFVVVSTSILQAIARFAEKRRSHKLAGNEFTEIKRKIEVALLEEVDLSRVIREVQSFHNLVARHYDLVSDGIWKKVDERVGTDLKRDSQMIGVVKSATKNIATVKNENGVDYIDKLSDSASLCETKVDQTQAPS